MNKLELIKAIREELQEQLKEKTGWGRNEVMDAFNRAVCAALLREPTNA